MVNFLGVFFIHVIRSWCRKLSDQIPDSRLATILWRRLFTLQRHLQTGHRCLQSPVVGGARGT